MIKDFETAKKQLQELSGVINNFKSEAVQLKIIDILFKGVKVIDDKEEVDNDEDDKVETIKTTSKKRKRKTKSDAGGEAKKKSSPKSGKLGPHSALTQLVNEDFFKTKRTIGDIVDYCKNNLATTIKSNDISGKLAALVRAKTLKRVRNVENNQYEYSNA